MHAVRIHPQDRSSRNRGFRNSCAVGVLVLLTAVPGALGQESISRSITVANHAPAVVTISEAISRSITVVNHAPANTTVSEAVSRSVTVVNHATIPSALGESISRSVTACNRAGFVDADGDGVHDCDDKCPGFDDRLDRDADGIPDACDNCPDYANPDQHDCDHDGLGDVCAIATWVSSDCNTNGVPDSCEAFRDCDENGEPDFCQVDCNHNDRADACEIADGSGEDCTNNGVLDECESDCNQNGLADSCDIASGRSADCGSNGIPDECEPDCNGNGLTDSCELLQGLAEDCNANSVPDTCESDCNRNRRADSCDIAYGSSEDCNGDGVPDECTPTAAADIDQNGAIDLADFAALQNCFGADVATDGSCSVADLSSDSSVALPDFLILQPGLGASPLLPDLSLAEAQAPTRAAQGETLSTTYTVSNVGCANANGTALLTLVLRSAGSLEPIGSPTTQELNFADFVHGSIRSTSLQVTIPAELEPGSYEILSCVQTTAPYCHEACDSAQDNNCIVQPLSVADDTPPIWISTVTQDGMLVSGRTGRLVVEVQRRNPDFLWFVLSVSAELDNEGATACNRIADSPSGILRFACNIAVPAENLVCRQRLAADVTMRLLAIPDSRGYLVATRDERIIQTSIRAPWWDLDFEIKRAPSSAAICSRIDWEVEVCNEGGVPSDNVCFFTGINLYRGAGNWINTNLGLVHFQSGNISPGACRTFRVNDYVIDYPDGFPCNAVRGTQYVKVEINYWPGGCFDHCSAGNFDEQAITIR